MSWGNDERPIRGVTADLEREDSEQVVRTKDDATIEAVSGSCYAGVGNERLGADRFEPSPFTGKGVSEGFGRTQPYEQWDSNPVRETVAIRKQQARFPTSIP